MEEDLEQAANKLASEMRAGGAVVITCGAGGAMVQTREGADAGVAARRTAALPGISPVDPTGAGPLRIPEPSPRPYSRNLETKERNLTFNPHPSILKTPQPSILNPGIATVHLRPSDLHPNTLKNLHPRNANPYTLSLSPES